MTPLNQDTLKLIDKAADSFMFPYECGKAMAAVLRDQAILKSAGLYTLQEMQTQMLNLLEKEEDKWVSVEDRLPLIDQDVLCYYTIESKKEKTIYEYTVIGRVDSITESGSGKHPSWIDKEYNSLTPTHWMTLPPKPTPPNQNI